MKIAMMQPAFMPWQGYFELIYKSDIFIFLDDFQFSVQSYHQRNRLFSIKGKVDWYTVSVKKSISFKSPLNKTVINDGTDWRGKMLNRMQNNYSGCAYYKELYPIIERWLSSANPSLADMNIAFIKLACDILGFQRDFRYSSDYPSGLDKSARVLYLLERCGADTYFCARGAFQYMADDKIFPVNHVNILFQDFKPAQYKQAGSTDDFVPSLSVLDALFNMGPKATADLIMSGTAKWWSWNEMKGLELCALK
jgi:WbqC-like protein family.